MIQNGELVTKPDRPIKPNTHLKVNKMNKNLLAFHAILDIEQEAFL